MQLWIMQELDCTFMSNSDRFVFFFYSVLFVDDIVSKWSASIRFELLGTPTLNR